MKWMADWIMREGPGIPKDAPKKQGLALFADICWREAWELFKLNALIFVCCIPIVTIPAAHAAATRIAVLMISDEVVFLGRDYWRAFRRYFLPATLWGLAFAAAIGLTGYAAFIYGQLALKSLAFVMPFALALSVSLFLAITAESLFVLMVRAPLAPLALLRAAFVATLARPLPGLAGLGFTAALWLLHIVLYPGSLLMPAMFNFSLGTLALAFGVFGAASFVLERGEAARAAPRATICNGVADAPERRM